MTQFRSNTSGSQFWLRNVAHNSMLCARTSSHLASVTAGQRSALTRQPLTLSQFTKQTFSNRSARRLELPETYRKQTTGTLSNRHKFTHRHLRHFSASNPRVPGGAPPLLDCGSEAAAFTRRRPHLPSIRAKRSFAHHAAAHTSSVTPRWPLLPRQHKVFIRMTPLLIQST